MTNSIQNIRLSPSSINSFYYCQAKWYKTYVEKERFKDTIHTIRGKAVHKACEDIFDESFMETVPFKVSLAVPLIEEQAMNALKSEWGKYAESLEALELDAGVEDTLFTQSALAIKEFVRLKVNEALVFMDKGKVKRFRTAFKRVAPTFRELWIDNREYNVGGYIDAVQSDVYSDDIALIDYKTSLRHGEMMPADYRRQLAIYALLYREKFGVTPKYVGINYLLDNNTLLLEVTDELIQFALDCIADVRSKILEWGTDKSKYSDVCRFRRSDGKWIEYKWKGD